MPAEHTDAQTVQNTEIDHNAFFCYAQRVHTGGDGGTDHAAGEDDNASAYMSATKSRADSGDQKKSSAAPVLNPGKQWGAGTDAVQVIKQMHGYHAENADAP